MKIAGPSVLSVMLCLSPAALADDAAIGALLERMEAAVLAGDPGAYLECVDKSHAEWAREQTNWAADLAGHTPEAFDMALTGEPAGEDGPAGKIGDLKIRWTLPGGRERSVEFAARFTPGEGGWLFAGEAWTELASADGQNIVLYLDKALEDTALRVIEVMPEIRGHVDEGFGASLDHPQVIKLYTDMGHLQESIYLSYTDPLGGWNEPGEAIKIVATERMGARQMRNLLAHEYGHVATFTYSPDASNNIPWWAAEGAAELAAEKFAGRRGREAVNEVVRAWANAGRLADWEDMADFRKTPSDLHGHVYTQGHQFVGYLSERFGRESRNLWLRRLAEGAGVEKATSEAFGLAFEQLDREWRASLEVGPPDADED
jgi:hypothetical protein